MDDDLRTRAANTLAAMITGSQVKDNGRGKKKIISYTTIDELAGTGSGTINGYTSGNRRINLGIMYKVADVFQARDPKNEHLRTFMGLIPEFEKEITEATNYHDCLRLIMQALSITNNELANAAVLSERTIRSATEGRTTLGKYNLERISTYLEQNGARKEWLNQFTKLFTDRERGHYRALDNIETQVTECHAQVALH